MTLPPAFVGPFIGSNVAALALLLLAWWRPPWARWTFAAVFVGAGIANAVMVRSDPAAYGEYARWALLDGYRAFILGSFGEHTVAYVSAIAAGQLAVGAALAFGHPWRDVGAAGGVAFLLAIAPLGAGSAFPATVVMALALALAAWRRPATAGSPRVRAGRARARSG